MTSIPSNLARVPNGLAANLMRGAIGRSGSDLLRLQIQLSTMSRINRPSDDPLGTGTVSVLDDVIERRDQRLRNFSHADAVMGTIDGALGELSGLLLEAKGIASSQIGVGSDAGTRANQAEVIDAMLSAAIGLANRKYQDIHLFAGGATAVTPMAGHALGMRYLGSGDGMYTDLGPGMRIPITLSGEAAFGALSARVEGDRDLDPRMSSSTRLLDLRGALGRGVSPGTVAVDIDGVDLEVDLTGAATIGDVAGALQAALASVNAGVTVGIDPASGHRLRIDAAGSTIRIFDQGNPGTAADLGIDRVFTDADPLGADVNPVITPLTRLDSFSGMTLPPGSIRLENGGRARDVDLSAVETVQELMTIVAGLDLGIRVEIAEAGDRLRFVNEISGAWMSIGEVGGGSTATELGVRSFSALTALADFNDGRGVQIRSGSVDPVTGLPDPARDIDFTVTLKDGSQVDVDLAGARTVGDVLDRINAAAATAGVSVPADFEARLAADGNGIALLDGTNGGSGTTRVDAMNGSFAALDLGILGSTAGAILAGEDRAQVAVPSVFTGLIRLRDALRGDDERGITLAGEGLEQSISRAAEARALVGVRNRRVTDAVEREQDMRIQDMELRSRIRDLDFTEAAMRFSLLETQLQAGLTAASRASSLSLLDFLR